MGNEAEVVQINQTEQYGLIDKSKETAQEIPLPENPIVVIEPSRGWIPVNLCDLCHYRDLLQILTMRDIKMRYKQTPLGAAWALIQPVFTMLVFTLFFGWLAANSSEGIRYPIFVSAGLLSGTFFLNAVLNSRNSLVRNSNLITKVYLRV